MGEDTKMALVIIVLGFIGFPIACGLFCLWVDHSNDYVARACRKANRKHYEWEQRQKRRRKK